MHQTNQISEDFLQPAHSSHLRDYQSMHLSWQPFIVVIICTFLISYALSQRPDAAAFIVGPTVWIGGILLLFFRAIHLGRFRLVYALQWTHSISACLIFMLMSPQFIGICMLIILDGLLDELLHPHTTKRRLQASIIGTITLTAGVVNIASLAHFDVYLLPQVLAPQEISMGHVLLVTPYTFDFLHRLWRFQKRIRASLATQQQTNNDLAAVQIKLQQQLHELNRILDISRAVESTMDMSSLLTHMLTRLRSILPYDHASVHMIRQAAYVEILSIGDSPDVATSVTNLLPRGDSTGAIVGLAEPVILPDVGKFSPSMLGALIMVPFIVRGICIGVLTLRHSEVGFYTHRDAELGTAFASQAAGMINAAQLREAARDAMIVAERHRLARELHDSVSQSLFGIVLGTRTAREQLERSPAAARDALDYSMQLASSALAEMRALIFTLRPETLERKGIISALQSQIDLLQPHLRIRITLRAPHGEPDASRYQKEALYRIASEAMQNAIRHARCHTLDMCLTIDAHDLVLEIADDGCGFNASLMSDGHVGLQAMHQHATDLNGRLVIDSAPGMGTRISLRMPLTSTERAS